MPHPDLLDEIVLFADPVLTPALAQTLMLAHPLASPKAFMRAAPILTVTPVTNIGALAARAAAPLADARLLICGVAEIVPEALLKCFPGPSYNLHPGPPERPGRYPSVFALYDGDRRFGTTLHEAAPAVDSGAIVGVERFAVPEGADRETLDAMSFASVLHLLAEATPALVARAPLPRLDTRWSGRRASLADFQALCRLPEGVDAEEFARRYRAVGEGPEHALEITLHGHRFRLDNRRGDAVVVGGLARSAGS